jgi:hypothetical protein
MHQLTFLMFDPKLITTIGPMNAESEDAVWAETRWERRADASNAIREVTSKGIVQEAEDLTQGHHPDQAEVHLEVTDADTEEIMAEAQESTEEVQVIQEALAAEVLTREELREAEAEVTVWARADQCLAEEEAEVTVLAASQSQSADLRDRDQTRDPRVVLLMMCQMEASTRTRALQSTKWKMLS